MFLLTGPWLIISLIVLRCTVTSAAIIGVLMGVVFLAARANEFLIASIRRHCRWAHVCWDRPLASWLPSRWSPPALHR